MTSIAAGAVASSSVPQLPDVELKRAVRLVWTTLGFLLLGVVVGLGWDRAWHATHPFEDFWSPPHLFIYTSVAVTGGVLARLVLAPELRACFVQRQIQLPVIGGIPAALFVAVAGLSTVLLAGLFDSIWHTTFGLDETGWSFPHAMLGWGLLLTLLGLLSSRLALGLERPVGWFGRSLLALLVLASVTGVLLGPLGNNNTPQLVGEIASLPVLAAEEDAQHTFRIYLEWNITRTAPLFVPLAALAAGLALRLTRGLVPKGLAFVGLVTIAMLLSLSGELRTARYFGIEEDTANWLPLPLLPAALVMLFCGLIRVPPALAWPLAGVVFGVVTASWWDIDGGWALTAAAVMPLGAHIGGRVEGIVRDPTPKSARALALAMALAVPGFLGAVDLYLRATTN